ncbi:hypothetical protein B9Z55_012929 [Caenorhabditis nigoni]|uniref:Uncharacterized protein n=1 Tax=Caenorhabditis nigoni TaxID=1611254 RepID=A0A2G5TZI1_9PELO|nr:hypothetical protein B9Z55_012929 [Caenorhabditis nigoni]
MRFFAKFSAKKFKILKFGILTLKEDSGQNEFMVQSMQNFMLIPNITMTMLKNAAKAQKTPSKLQKSYPSWPNFCRFSTWISIFALFT